MTRDDILTIPEVAELLRIAEKTVYTLAQKGKLPAFKVGGQWRFSRSSIESWIEERTRSGQQTGASTGSARAPESGPSASGASKVKARRRR